MEGLQDPIGLSAARGLVSVDGHHTVRRPKLARSPAMALRPSQIRATSVDGVLIILGALALRGDYKNLTLPVVIIAGEGDKVVFKRRSERLRGPASGAARCG
jgi:hypothetical protein